MSDSKKKMSKVVASILLIFAVPILFFQLLGGSLVDINGPKKQMIAIVNEDLGIDKEEETIDMGREVVAILAKDSPYEWKVMGRGAAVNGLKANQYEAIVYIPSDFSKNIMSYDEQNPVKAEFAYQVQRQKSGLEKENVLHEIESATNRVNQKISTLYWSYVSLEMDHIKKEFATILGKETEFLGAMSAFYKPESETLVANMERQKEQIENLRSTVQGADESHDSRIGNTEAFGQQLDEFVSHVQQYKDFQVDQKDVLLQVQQSSLSKINDAALNQLQRYKESMGVLDDNDEQLAGELLAVDEKLANNQQHMNDLLALREMQANLLMEDIVAIATDEIGVKLSDPEKQAIQEDLEWRANDRQNTVLPELSEEQEKLNTVLAKLASLKEEVLLMDPESTLPTDIEQTTEELSAVKTTISEKEKVWSEARQQLLADYVQASADYKDLYEILEQTGLLFTEQVGKNVYEDMLKDHVLALTLKYFTELSEHEMAMWNTLLTGVKGTKQEVGELGALLGAFQLEYREQVEEQHTALLDDLSEINYQAATLLTQIETPSTLLGTGEPQANVGEGEVVAGQQNVSTELVSLSGLVRSVSERQDGLVNAAQDLQAKTASFGDKSLVFSDKWETNLDAMTAFKDDIQGFLANTYVDGQENGYVFNHFVNPLQTKGEAAFSDEVKKVPPVMLFMILLISSLVIGFFSHRFQEGSIALRTGMTVLLSVLVGLIISLYSVNMYLLTDDRAIEWTVFTVLLLLASAATIRTALDVGQTTGWLASIALMCLYSSPLLILGVPDINMPDVLSDVYTSIQYEPDTLFIGGAVIAAIIAVVMLSVSIVMSKRKKMDPEQEKPEVEHAQGA
ncbi:type VII secretion protein EsaA [Sporosarcina sp. NPDC096371]|uniref:type VII secretion protein EsaA n=1 Tax=Sporosarcina sp. NPDC096371 TaxID=3364530 RepID=UPI0037FB9DF3